MSEKIPNQTKTQDVLKGQFKSMAAALLLGPYFATAAFFFIQGIIGLLTLNAQKFSLMFGGFGLGIISAVFGWPLVVMILILALPTLGNPRISLASTLTITALGSIAMIYFAWLGNRSWFVVDMTIGLLSTLISAAICWWITKSWHSPEPDVDCSAPKNERDAPPPPQSAEITA